jgi:hypothetical protein
MTVMVSRLTRLLAGAALATSLATAARAQASNAFDGNWIVTTVCPKAFDGSSAYTLRFAAVVKNGVFHGENGVKGEAGYLSLDGTIAPDGSAVLRGQGLTADTAYNVLHAAPLTPFTYHVKSQFSASQGTGIRQELRPCENTYTRQ